MTDIEPSEQDKGAHQESSGTTSPSSAGTRGIAIGGSAQQSTLVTGDHNTVNVTYQGVQVSIPSPEAIAQHRSALRQRLAAEAHARWGGMSVYIQEEGAALPIEASPYQTGRLGPRENLLRSLHAADRLLVLGEPGSGKTVSLERLAWELCGEETTAVPVLVRLFHYAGTPLKEWVRSTLQETGHLRMDDDRALAAFLKEGQARCFFLFDGLNEVPPPYRDRLIDELVRWTAAHPRHPVVLTSRPQDELWRRLRAEVRRAVMVQPIADARVQAYLEAHLAEKGADLYKRLDERLREMARTPLILWLIKEAGAAGESVPGNRGELYDRFVARMLRRDTDRRLDAEIPDRVKRRALAGLAYHLNLGQRLSCSREEALDVIAQRLGEELAGPVLGACRRHGLLAGEEALWFAPHQTVQEYFAALELRALTAQEWAMGGWERLRRRLRQLFGEEQGLTALAGEDWWMETFVQLAGLVDDADRLARDVLQVNPWLAWWCVEEGRSVVEETREAVADRSTRLLESERVVDRRRAVAALAHIRNKRVIRPLFQAAGDEDAEVAGLAVETLGQMGEAAKAIVADSLQGKDRRLMPAAVRYLTTFPDDSLCRQVPWEEWLGLPMVLVPAGPFLMGSDEKRDAQAHERELPQHEVMLPGYWIGKYPVTVAQFWAFVEESGYDWAGQGEKQGGEDHPVVYVSWHDALAYCRWLTQKTGVAVRLPSEAEWEKAARGTGGRIYPWGDDPPDERRCNFTNNVGQTTPVGQYSPQGDSPYGCVDMAGNVWEWTRSLWGKSWEKLDFGYPYDPRDGREDLKSRYDAPRVLRGGAFVSLARNVRCAYRNWFDPASRYAGGGFRVVVVPFSPTSEL